MTLSIVMSYLFIILFILTIKGAHLFLDTVPKECTKGFVRHENSCYHVSHETETWANAMVICSKLHGGYLAEITGMPENNFINGLLQGGRLAGMVAFLGGNDLLIENEFTWAESKADLKFHNYYSSHPINGTAGDNCLVIRTDGYWDGFSCHSPVRYVCEKTLNY